MITSPKIFFYLNLIQIIKRGNNKTLTSPKIFFYLIQIIKKRADKALIDSRHVEIIRIFFNDKFKYLNKDKLSQVYLSIKFTDNDLDELFRILLENNIVDNNLSVDSLKLMFQAYCMESFNTTSSFVLKDFMMQIMTNIAAPVLVGIVVLSRQQSVLEATGAVKSDDMITVTSCKKQLDKKGYAELASLCGPLKNGLFQTADTETYNAIGKIVHGDKWGLENKKSYSDNQISNINGICPKLQEIDKLWKEASEGRLGFSAQRKIWNKTKSYPAFTRDIGWRDNNGWTVISYDLERVRDGHLPALWNQTHKDSTVGKGSGQEDYKNFFEFIESCDLDK